jgi:hypothetical protein
MLVRGTLGVLVLLTATIGGCNLVTGHLDRDEDELRALHEAARSLVPPGARIVHEEESGCAELRAYPNCVRIDFDVRGTDAARIRETRKLLAAGGWQRAPGSPSFVYERDDLRASVAVVRHTEGWRQDCAASAFDEGDRYDRARCLDSVLVRFG